MNLGQFLTRYAFFSLIHKNVDLSSGERTLLARLFRKYVRYDELEKTALMMTVCEKFFALTQIDLAAMKASGWKPEESLLTINCSTLGNVFSKYFEALDYCIESAYGFHTDWGIYKPVMTIICEMHEYLVEKLDHWTIMII